LEETDILSRENVAIPTWKDFYTSCFEWARSQKPERQISSFATDLGRKSTERRLSDRRGVVFR
jgi:hypothetical protein